ncbi:thiamine phosphate synthase [Candidatus Latescibacterota bacterium]
MTRSIISTEKKSKGWRTLKKDSLENIDFYLLTDSGLSMGGILDDVKQAVDAGCGIVQYREKNKSTRDMVSEASAIKEICAGKAVFLVNDRIDVAMAVDADGVHIGQDDMPFETARKLLGDNKIIGLTVHNDTEAIEAEALGADYVGLSPIYATSTKKDAGTACGTAMIEQTKKTVTIPIVAIGGINKENVREVVTAGADSIVAISAVLTSGDVYGETRDFINIALAAKK